MYGPPPLRDPRRRTANRQSPRRSSAAPGIATLDPEMLTRVAAFARDRGIGADRLEYQMLYGIRRDLQRRLLTGGARLRVYVPYGTEWYPYFMRRLAERPANVLFVLAQHLRGAILKGPPPGGRLRGTPMSATKRPSTSSLRRYLTSRPYIAAPTSGDGSASSPMR